MNKYVVVVGEKIYPLMQMNPDEFDRELKPDDVTGIPVYYKEVGSILYVWPKMREDAGIELFILQKVSAL